MKYSVVYWDEKEEEKDFKTLKEMNEWWIDNCEKIKKLTRIEEGALQ